VPSTSVLAEPATDARVLRLKRGEERRLSSGHLWVFSNEIDTDSTPLSAYEPGALAQLRSHRDAFLGYVCVNPHALICARILSRDIERPVGAALLEQRLRSALSLRERVRTAPYYRWVFGESDLLPGLVLDRYGDLVVGQIATAGLQALKNEVASAVGRGLAPAAR
jgi:23S rRNA (cytosine1962-C5)-methyltransferase